MAAVTICSNFGAQENKVGYVSIVSLSICHEVMGLDAMIFVFWMLCFKPTFSTLLFHLHQEALEFLFVFCHKGAVIYIPETGGINQDLSLLVVRRCRNPL